MKPAKMPDAPLEGGVPSPPEVPPKSTPAEQARARRAIRKQLKRTYEKLFSKHSHSTAPIPGAGGGEWANEREAARELLDAHRAGLPEFAEAVLELEPGIGVLYALVSFALREHDEDSHAKGGKAKAAKAAPVKQALEAAFLKARNENPKISIPKFVGQWIDGFYAQNQEPPLKESTAIRHLRMVMKLKKK